jgi:hypothetical protein
MPKKKLLGGRKNIKDGGWNVFEWGKFIVLIKLE